MIAKVPVIWSCLSKNASSGEILEDYGYYRSDRISGLTAQYPLVPRIDDACREGVAEIAAAARHVAISITVGDFVGDVREIAEQQDALEQFAFTRAADTA